MHLLQPFRLLGAVAILGMLAACATTSVSTEDMLTAAGFKTVPAKTSKQLQQLQSLPKGKVSFAKQKGKAYFVYPDPANKLLFVGGKQQYQNYQQLRIQKGINEDNLQIAEMNRQTAQIEAWEDWEDWAAVGGAPMYGIPVE